MAHRERSQLRLAPQLRWITHSPQLARFSRRLLEQTLDAVKDWPPHESAETPFWVRVQGFDVSEEGVARLEDSEEAARHPEDLAFARLICGSVHSSLVASGFDHVGLGWTLAREGPSVGAAIWPEPPYEPGQCCFSVHLGFSRLDDASIGIINRDVLGGGLSDLRFSARLDSTPANCSARPKCSYGRSTSKPSRSPLQGAFGVSTATRDFRESGSTQGIGFTN